MKAESKPLQKIKLLGFHKAFWNRPTCPDLRVEFWTENLLLGGLQIRPRAETPRPNVFLGPFVAVTLKLIKASSPQTANSKASTVNWREPANYVRNLGSSIQ